MGGKSNTIYTLGCKHAYYSLFLFADLLLTGITLKTSANLLRRYTDGLHSVSGFLSATGKFFI